MIRAVCDTNVLVSALLKPSGPPGNLLRGLRNGSFIVVFSPAFLDEIAAVIMSSKISIKYGLSRREVETVFSLFALRGEIAEGTEKIRVCRDPEDDFLIEAAVAGRADYLVTGDNDLLALKKFRNTKIVRLQTFVSLLESSPVQNR